MARRIRQPSPVCSHEPRRVRRRTPLRSPVCFQEAPKGPPSSFTVVTRSMITSTHPFPPGPTRGSIGRTYSPLNITNSCLAPPHSDHALSISSQGRILPVRSQATPKGSQSNSGFYRLWILSALDSLGALSRDPEGSAIELSTIVRSQETPKGLQPNSTSSSISSNSISSSISW